MPSGLPDTHGHADACAGMADRTSAAALAPTAHPERAGLRFTVVPEWCVRPQGGACSRCADVCPTKAIALPPADNGTPTVLPQACTDCGVCQGVCDAFASTVRTVQDSAARVLRAAAHGDAVCVACEELVPDGEEPAANAVVLPCLAAGCAEFWTLALSAETPVLVACDFDRCRSCEKAGTEALDLFSDAIETAQAWTGRTVGFADEVPLARTLVQEYARNEEFDRRGMFRRMAVDAAEAANGTRRAKTANVLQDFRRRQERLRATARLAAPENGAFSNFVPEGRTRRLVPPRERMMEEACRRLPALAERSHGGTGPEEA